MSTSEKHDNPLELLEGAGVRIHEVGQLPDGSGFAVSSFPLRKDHWLYATVDNNNPPMPFRMGTADPRRARWELGITLAARYACRASTMNGKEEDFDPDAMVRNFITGMLGYNTPDGLTGIEGESDLWNPNPVPPIFQDGGDLPLTVDDFCAPQDVGEPPAEVTEGYPA